MLQDTTLQILSTVIGIQPSVRMDIEPDAVDREITSPCSLSKGEVGVGMNLETAMSGTTLGLLAWQADVIACLLGLKFPNAEATPDQLNLAKAFQYCFKLIG